MTAHPSPAAIDEAAQILVDARAKRDALTPRQAAEAAHVPGRPSVDDLERLIRAQRAEALGEVRSA